MTEAFWLKADSPVNVSDLELSSADLAVPFLAPLNGPPLAPLAKLELMHQYPMDTFLASIRAYAADPRLYYSDRPPANKRSPEVF
jgi:hypothetical protein